jgi:hypothetical protein
MRVIKAPLLVLALVAGTNPFFTACGEPGVEDESYVEREGEYWEDDGQGAELGATALALGESGCTTVALTDPTDTADVRRVPQDVESPSRSYGSARCPRQFVIGVGNQGAGLEYLSNVYWADSAVSERDCPNARIVMTQWWRTTAPHASQEWRDGIEVRLRGKWIEADCEPGDICFPSRCEFLQEDGRHARPHLHSGSPYLSYRYAVRATVDGERRRAGMTFYRNVR